MPANRDFSDLFAALNGAHVEYLLVGGYAVAFHAEPRFTKDLNVWVNATPDNARRVYSALATFGAPLDGVVAGDFAHPGVVYQMGLPPNRIDVVTAIDGPTWPEAWAEHVETQYGDERVPVIGLDCLIRNKLASGRPQDLLDVEVLRRHT